MDKAAVSTSDCKEQKSQTRLTYRDWFFAAGAGLAAAIVRALSGRMRGYSNFNPKYQDLSKIHEY